MPKIAVYGKRLTSDTLFAVKTKPLTVKCFTYTIYSNDQKRRTEILCFTAVTWWMISNDFPAHVAWRLTCAVSRLYLKTGRLDKLIVVHCQRRTTTRTPSYGCPKLFLISDNVSVVTQDT